MKDYVQSKLKRSKKIAFGHGPSKDEQRAAARARANVIQANADTLGDTFTRLTPPYSNDNLASFAALESIDLISEGPIEGFVSPDGRPCNPLRGSYLDGTVVLESSLSKRFSAHFYSGGNNNAFLGCFLDATGKQVEILDEYSGYIDSIYNDKETITDPQLLLPDITAKPARAHKTAFKIDYNQALSDINNTEARSYYVYFNSPEPDTTNFLGDPSFFLDAANTVGKNSGAGYTRSPVVIQSIFGQDQVLDLPSNGGMPSTPFFNTYSFERPVRFIANVAYESEIDSLGRITECFCKRAFFQNIISLRSGGVNNTNWNNLTAYADRAVRLPGTSWNSGVDGARCYERFEYSLDPTRKEAEGFKEPVFEKLTRMKNFITGIYETKKNYGYFLFDASKIPLIDVFVEPVQLSNEMRNYSDRYLNIWIEVFNYYAGLAGNSEFNFSLNALSDLLNAAGDTNSSPSTTQNIKKRPQGIDLFLPFAQGGEKESVGVLTNFENFRNLNSVSLSESIVREVKFWPLGSRGRQGEFPEIASDRSQTRSIQNSPAKSSKMAGIYKWPVYLGPNYEACDDSGDPDLNRIVVTSGDSSQTRRNKIQSGVDLSYDVFELVEDDIIASPNDLLFVENGFTTGLTCRIFADYVEGSLQGGDEPYELDNATRTSGLKAIGTGLEDFWPGIGHPPGSLRSGYNKGMINNFNFANDNEYYKVPFKTTPKFFIEAIGFFRAPVSGHYVISTHNPTLGQDYNHIFVNPNNQGTHTQDVLYVWTGQKATTGDRNVSAPINPRRYGILDGRPDIRDYGDDDVILRDQQFVELSGLRSGQMVPICIQFYHAGRELGSKDYWAGLSWGRRVKVRQFDTDTEGLLDLTRYGYAYSNLKNQFHWNDHFNGVFYSYTGFTGLSDSEYFDERTGTLWSDATGLLDSFKEDAIGLPNEDEEFPHLPVNGTFLKSTFLHASSADYPRPSHSREKAMLSGSNLTVLPTFEEVVLSAGIRLKGQVFRYLNVGNNTSNLANSEILQRTLGLTVEQRNELPSSRQLFNIVDRAANQLTDWYLGEDNDGGSNASSNNNNRPIFGAQFFTDADNFVTPQAYGVESNIKGASKIGGIANFSNVSVEFRNGQEQQDPLKTKSITDFFVQKNLVGPYNPNQTYGSTYLTGKSVEGYFDPDNTLVTGISGVQFDGQWDETVSDFINDISNNTVQLRWVRDNIFYPDDSLISNDTTFTIEVAGFIYVENTSNYEFRLNSDDRSKVWIGESAESGKFNDNNYLVTAFHPNQVIGYTGLAGGVYYPIRYIAENGGGLYEFKLDFRVSGSSDSYESVTGFYHKPNGAHPLMTDSLVSGSGYLIETNLDEQGRIKYGASEGTASEDARFGRNYSNWLAETPLDSDDNVVKHVIYRKEVDSVIGGFLIDALFSTEIFDEDPFNVQVNRSKAQLNIEVELGFEGLDQSIFTPTKTTQTYEGSVSNQYAVDQEFTLPKYSEIIGSFEGETTTSLNEKHPRYIKFKKLDFETDSTLIARSVSVFKVSEIVDCDFSYPSSAVVKFQTDARTFNNIPTRTYNLRLKKVLVPSNYFPLNSLGKDKRYIDTLSDKKYNYVNGQEAYRHVYIGDWDGSFKLAWTDNPAWVLYDLLTNDRYGIASRLDDLEDIDIFNLYKIGRYCDAVDSEGRFVGVPNGKGGLEPRFACNILLDAKENAFQTINSIAAVFNGMAYWSNGTINFFADQPKDVSALFNNQNVFDGFFQYEDTLKNSRFNTVEVQFVDKDNDYRIKTEIVEDEEGIRKNGIIRKTFNARGTTSRSQARRLGRYLLYTNKNETEIVKFKTDPQALLLNIGDIFKVEDEIKNFEVTASRVVGSNNSQETITVEKTFNTGIILTGVENPISVYLPTGQTTKKDLYNTISTGGKITETELDKYNKTSIKEFVITGMTEETDGIKLNLETSLFKNGYTSLRISGINTDGGPPNRTRFHLFEENSIDGQDAWNFFEIKFMAKGDVPYPRNPIGPNTDLESPLTNGAFGLGITGATGSIDSFNISNIGSYVRRFEGFALAGSGTGFALLEQGDGTFIGAIQGNPELQAHSAYKNKYNGGIAQNTLFDFANQIDDSEVFDFQNGFNQFNFYDDSNSNITKTEITGIYFFPGFFHGYIEGFVNGLFDFLTGGPVPSGIHRAKTTQFILSDTTGFDSENVKVGAEFVIDEDSYTGRAKLVMDWTSATHGSTGYQDRTGEDGNLTGLIPLPIGKRAILRKDTSIDYEDLNYGVFEDYNNANLDKIESGSYASFRLKNTQPQLYKTMAIDHEENNLYSVMGVFHDTGKFEAIETQDFDFKYQFTGYNIGIPESAVNKITEPSGFTTTSEYLESENIINFKISGDPQGNEDAYLISVVYPNGRRNQKRVLKGTEIENNFIVTSGFITELDSYGNYKLTVQSERR
jgi:hypothetical protein